MNDWISIYDPLHRPGPGQPIEAKILSATSPGGEAIVDGIRSKDEPTVVLFDFYSGTGAEVILEWRPRALPMKEDAHPWTGIANSGGANPWRGRGPKNETPESIVAWADETFGPTHPGPIARRMLVEVKELIEAFDLSEDLPVAELDKSTVGHLREEVADISIMLDQVGVLLGGDVQKAKNAKMRVNRERRWAYDPKRKQVRHVERFVEEGTGVTMELERWYLMTVNRKWCVYPAGFDTARAALDHGQETRLSAVWEAGIVRLDHSNNSWTRTSGYTFVAVLGRDLYDFQTRNKDDD